MQFADFSSVGFNQIVNQAATLFWRTFLPCPITIRLPSGGTPGSGPFHSQCMETIYAHYPGTIVMAPSTVEDAYSMLLDAILIDDPVIFCEHKYLYYHLKANELPKKTLHASKARIVRPGRHATIVTYSAMVHEAVSAAEKLSRDGYEIEIVDLRCVKPIDIETVLGSIARTGRVLAIGEAFPWGGVTAEIVSQISSEGVNLLDAPPARLNSVDTPIPYHPELWRFHRPTANSIEDKIRKLIKD